MDGCCRRGALRMATRVRPFRRNRARWGCRALASCRRCEGSADPRPCRHPSGAERKVSKRPVSHTLEQGHEFASRVAECVPGSTLQRPREAPDPSRGRPATTPGRVLERTPAVLRGHGPSAAPEGEHLTRRKPGPAHPQGVGARLATRAALLANSGRRGARHPPEGGEPGRRGEPRHSTGEEPRRRTTRVHRHRGPGGPGGGRGPGVGHLRPHPRPAQRGRPGPVTALSTGLHYLLALGTQDALQAAAAELAAPPASPPAGPTPRPSARARPRRRPAAVPLGLALQRALPNRPGEAMPRGAARQAGWRTASTGIAALLARGGALGAPRPRRPAGCRGTRGAPAGGGAARAGHRVRPRPPPSGAPRRRRPPEPPTPPLGAVGCSWPGEWRAGSRRSPTPSTSSPRPRGAGSRSCSPAGRRCGGWRRTRHPSVRWRPAPRWSGRGRCARSRRGGCRGAGAR